MKKQFIVAGILLCLACTKVNGQVQWNKKPSTIETRWAKDVTPTKVLAEYPRPQLIRSKWINLNGLWDYAITDNKESSVSHYDGKILVPYPIESSLSGISKRLEPNQLLWYKRTISKPSLKNGERVLLHFGAVDFDATVYLNAREVGNHKGGYQNFSFDITEQLKSGNNELSVKVWDPTDEGPNPHGKQVLNPGGIRYTASSGIWQTVWMETVPANYIQSLTIVPDVDKKQIRVKINALSDTPITLIADGKIRKGKANSEITFPLTTLKLWSPDHPYLYDLTVTMGEDKVKSYFGMRKIEIKKDAQGIDRIFLNNKYTYNLGTLDQGFWPDGLYTAPTDEALQFDIKAIKAMGFNTIRKHIKIEPDRWYYFCDKLGMLVWQDMVNPGNDSEEGHKEFEKECKESIVQLFNHPSIITWVLFNEGWGTYDQERLTKWIKSLDPTRLLNGHSGSAIVSGVVNNYTPVIEKSINSDMTDVHSYPPPAIPPYIKGKAMVLGEFGGIAVSVENHLWNPLQAGFGYGNVVAPPQMKKDYTTMINQLAKLQKEGLSASIYTQPFDVEGEQNGLMTYDRAISKLSLTDYRKLNAVLWPATTNYIIAANTMSTKVADTINKTYAARLNEYKNGRKDSAFLYTLSVLAEKENDADNVTKLSNEYINLLKDPFIPGNMAFIVHFTKDDKNAGYEILMNHMNEAMQASPQALNPIQLIIFRKEVRPLLNENPDWTHVKAIIKKYPAIKDGEFIIGNSVIRYLQATAEGQKNATRNLVEAATLYDDLFNSGAYNSWAWQLFLHTNDTFELTKALEWSRKSIDREPDSPNQLDTYANLLFKLGKKEEALEWQTKAVAKAPQDADIKQNYEKMKSGIPTWTGQ